MHSLNLYDILLLFARFRVTMRITHPSEQHKQRAYIHYVDGLKYIDS